MIELICRVDQSVQTPTPSRSGFVLFAAGVTMPPGSVNLNAGLTYVEAAGLLGVSPATVAMWALRGWEASTGERRRLAVVGRRGRSRLYRYGDLVDAEADTRRSPFSRRVAV
jgi:hypothetical protein